MKKLRLLVTPYCPRQCTGCCNLSWNLNLLPICEDYSQYDEILLTGGEPLSNIVDLNLCIKDVVSQKKETAKIYLYTAGINTPLKYTYITSLIIMEILNGVTITLHDNSDKQYLTEFDYYLKDNLKGCPITEENLSLRLNVFKEVDFDPSTLRCNWKIKDNIEWIPDCPLPEDEEFMRYK